MKPTHENAADPGSRAGLDRRIRSVGPAPPAITPGQLRERIADSALAFRGYDAGNLGRSLDLIDHPLYGPKARAVLEHASRICSEAAGEPVDLIAYIRAGNQAGPSDLANDNAALVSMQVVQLQLLEDFFGVEASQARYSFGFSTGELAALTFSRVLTFEWLLRFFVPIARDCAQLSPQACLAAVSARNGALEVDELDGLCRMVRAEGGGLIGPTAQLSNRAALVVGEHRSIDRLAQLLAERRPRLDAFLRKKQDRWTPLHSPIVWRRSIPNRIATLLHDIPGLMSPAVPPVASCVPRTDWYDPSNVRDVLPRWADHPQQLSRVVGATIASGVSTVVHVGPNPDLIPRAFAWAEAEGGGLPPDRARGAGRSAAGSGGGGPQEAPRVDHVVLEDWLLSQTPVVGGPPRAGVADRV